MYPINRSIGRGFTGTPGSLYDILTQLQNMSLSSYGTVYYVDANAGSDGYDGLSWEKCFATVAYAITISNANISRGPQGWQSRNTIFMKGTFTETLVVAPAKCDLIGVGSTNATPMGRLVGTQAILSTAWGSRFINIWFNDDGASATFTSTAGGLEFHNCWFQGVGTTVGTYGLYVTNPSQLVVKNCVFSSYLENPFSTAAIALIADGQYNDVLIEGNRIYGAKGIYCYDNALNNHFNCMIKDNYIRATTFCIDDDTDDYEIVGNMMLSAAAESGAIDVNAALAVGNIITTSDDTRTYPFATVS